jgi:hypothetical protein
MISVVSVEAPEVRIVDFFGGPLPPQRNRRFLDDDDANLT